MLEAVVFDVDGTLWDACREVMAAWDHAKKELFGQPFEMDFDLFVSLFGKTTIAFAPHLFPGEPIDQALEKTVQVQEASAKWLRKQPAQVFDGVREMMQELSKHYQIYIVSNCQLGYIETVIEAGGLEPYVNDHLCYGETMVPKSETIRMIMERNHVENIVYVGDTPADAEACKEADVPFLFVEYGFGEVEGDYPRAKTVADIPRVVARLDQD